MNGLFTDFGSRFDSRLDPANSHTSLAAMANPQGQKPNLDRYVVIHVATTCDEHGVYVTKDSAEVIELGWVLLDAKNCDEVGTLAASIIRCKANNDL